MRVTDLAFAEAPVRVTDRAERRAHCDVAVIGAGPYGLAAASHLAAAGFAIRVFGEPMGFWRRNMPRGMKLRHATDIETAPAFPLDAFLANNRLASPGPLPLEHFLAYADWAQRNAVPDVDRRHVVRLTEAGGRFALRLEDGEVVETSRVVVALGLKHQEHRPPLFAQMPPSLVSHSSEHADFDEFCGARVAVIGRGQSACESAVLLKEAGADVDIVCRGPIHWIGSETPRQGAGLHWRLHRLLTPKFAIGPFPLSWLADTPDLLRCVPNPLRARISERCLRPVATAWLRPRVGGIAVHAGKSVMDMEPKGERLSLRMHHGSSLLVDHVLLATGYHTDIGKYALLSPDLLGRVEQIDGSPVLSPAFESSVPGLHFIGACAVTSFGPLLRFVAGTGYAARAVARGVFASQTR
jgi:cation diffusion facilitator CzcD-associated flavoprotein CzcO